MSVKHRVRTREEGKTKLVTLTPQQAIRLACVECMGFELVGPRECTSPLCPLFPFRTGRQDKDYHPISETEALRYVYARI